MLLEQEWAKTHSCLLSRRGNYPSRSREWVVDDRQSALDSLRGARAGITCDNKQEWVFAHSCSSNMYHPLYSNMFPTGMQGVPAKMLQFTHS